MRETIDNPATNVLGPGLTEEAITSAIEGSGYPLQTLVASRLNAKFNVVEEWGYIDDTTKEHRSLDLFASHDLSTNPAERHPPAVLLLIECKRSVLPHVFFEQVAWRNLSEFPAVVGVPRNIPLQAGSTTRHVSPAQILGLNEEPLAVKGPPTSAAFSKSVRKGKDLELSGSDAFNGSILPLVKAQRALERLHTGTSLYMPMLALCLYVIDGPMVLVRGPNNKYEQVLCPWIRIMRNESGVDVRERPVRYHYAVEAVHVDFLAEYVDKHVLPFARTFAERVPAANPIFKFGGKVDNLDAWHRRDIKPRDP